MMEYQAPPGAQAPLQTQDKLHFHYKHTDSCRFLRWTAKESYDFMDARPWKKVNDFYLDMVNGCTSLSDLFQEEKDPLNTRTVYEDDETVEDCNNIIADKKDGRWARVSFKIVLSYHGSSFDGWQRQPGLSTVQGFVEQSLGKFVDDQKAQQLKDRSLPLEGCALVAGRTDKGVSAFKQVVSFYTWRKDVRAEDVKDAIGAVQPGKIRVVSVNKVSRDFHPNFSAKWRHYVYIFPFNDGGHEKKIIHDDKGKKDSQGAGEGELVTKPASFEVNKVNQLLNQLEGKLLSYKNFARDTKASRSVGPPTECYVFHARAAEASISAKDGNHTKIMCIELVANRFLRKMVRVLVATAIREAAAGAEDDALLKLMDATCRRATAPPAPPDGLCLFNVGYSDFDNTNCLIA